jgi:fused signal recognition particle receptor
LESSHQEEKIGFFTKLKKGLSKTREGFVGRIDELLLGKIKIEGELFEELEEILYTADLGVKTATTLVTEIQKQVNQSKTKDAAFIKEILKLQIAALLQADEAPLPLSEHQPFVILVLGVNGVGKTTTIGKLGSKFKSEGKSVLLAAGDTFRAAAVEQLDIWGGRIGCDVIRHKNGADPSAVAFDAIKAAQARNIDVVLIDTAGRLHTKVNLMEEVKKIRRVIGREYPGAPHESLLVLDATTGQNAFQQVKTFKSDLDVTGLVLTKLDGTAKGGCVVGISDEFHIPIRYIGIGETLEDLRIFNPKDFVDAIFK